MSLSRRDWWFVMIAGCAAHVALGCAACGYAAHARSARAELAAERSPAMRVATRSVFIACPPHEAFRFLADGANWPRWAIHNVLEVRTAGAMAWQMRTPRGWGRLEIRGNEDLGTLDHVFLDPEGSWLVPARVVPAPGGCVFVLTLAQPVDMPDEVYPRALALIDDELNTLSRLLGRPRDGSTCSRKVL